MENEYFASINEVSKRLSIPAHTLRYWEKQFPVAIRPTTGAGGRRYYRSETVNRLIVIKDLLYKHGMTIAGVKKLLRDGNFPQSADALISGTPSVATPMPAPAAVAPVTQSLSRDASVDVELALRLLKQARDLLS